MAHDVADTILRPSCQRPSWRNEQEVAVVVDVVRKLMDRGSFARYGASSSLGIISPYRLQCKSLRAALVEILPENDMPKIGSVGQSVCESILLLIFPICSHFQLRRGIPRR